MSKSAAHNHRCPPAHPASPPLVAGIIVLWTAAMGVWPGSARGGWGEPGGLDPTATARAQDMLEADDGLIPCLFPVEPHPASGWNAEAEAAALRSRVALLLANAAASDSNAGAEAAATPSGEAIALLTAEGPLMRMAPRLRRLACLDLHNGAVVIDRPGWIRSAQEAGVRPRRFGRQAQEEAVLDELTAASGLFGEATRAGGMHGASTSTSFSGQDNTPSRIARSSQGRSAEAEISLRAETMSLTIQERTEPRRRLVMIEKPAGLELTVTTPGHTMLRLHQSSGGSFALIFTDGAGSAMHLVADSFEKLIEDHPQLYHVSLAPLLYQMGIDMPLTKRDPRIQRCILDAIFTGDGANDARTGALVDELSDADFQTRERSQDTLRRQFPLHRDAVIGALLEIDRPLEVEARAFLESLLAEQDFESARLVRFIWNRRLIEDGDYLASLRGLLDEDDDARRALDRYLVGLGGDEQEVKPPQEPASPVEAGHGNDAGRADGPGNDDTPRGRPGHDRESR